MDKAFKILVLNLLSMILHIVFWHTWEERKEIEPDLKSHFDNVQMVTTEQIREMNDEARFEKWYPEFKRRLGEGR